MVVPDQVALTFTADDGLSLAVIAGDEQLQTRLQGGLTTAVDAWRGRLDTLQLTTGKFGQWSLEKPAPLELGAQEAMLGNSCFSREGGPGQTCLSGSWSASASSSFTLALQSIPLEILVSPTRQTLRHWIG